MAELTPRRVIDFLLKRRFSFIDAAFEEALSVASLRFARTGGDLSDDILDAFWNELTWRKRRQLSRKLKYDYATTLTSESRLTLRAVIEEISERRSELHELPDGELRDLYDAEISADQPKLEAVIQAKELWADHNSLEARAINPVWRSRARWTIEQGVALALGREPSVVNTNSLNLVMGSENSPFVGAYRNLLEDAELAVQAGELQNPLQPTEFAEWLEKRQISLPEAARPAAFTQTVAELEARRAELTAENQRLLEKVAHLEGDIQNLRLELGKKSALIKDLRQDVSEVSHNRKIALYSIIYGLATSHYKYKPEAQRGPGVTQMVDDLALSDYPVRHDAVKNVLIEAKRLLEEQ